MCATILGISQTLRSDCPGAEGVVNSVFLYTARRPGFGSGHRESEEEETRAVASIPTQERELRRRILLFSHPPKAGYADHSKSRPARKNCFRRTWREQNKNSAPGGSINHIAAFTEIFALQRKRRRVRRTLPLDERLQINIIEGTRDGPINDLERSGPKGPRPLEHWWNGGPADDGDGGSRPAVYRWREVI